MVRSPTFTCFGHTWSLRLHPNGDNSSESGKVAIYLEHWTNDNIKVRFTLNVKGMGGHHIINTLPLRADFAGRHNEACGQSNFLSHAAIFSSHVLVNNDALVLDIKMMQTEKRSAPVIPFVPENPLGKMILNLFLDDMSADIVFEVSNKQQVGNDRMKRAKTSPKLFHAHILILKEAAPALAPLCTKPMSEGLIPIPITDVKPEVFCHMLYYIYGGKLSPEDLKVNAKSIIEAADKFGVSALKLEAEAYYVRSNPIALDNMLEHLLYANAKNCALLKEAVMDFIIENPGDVAKKVSSFQGVIEGQPLLADILKAIASARRELGEEKGDKLSMMRVNELRKKLDEKGLNVDGSRESMIATLKEDQEDE